MTIRGMSKIIRSSICRLDSIWTALSWRCIGELEVEEVINIGLLYYETKRY